MSNERGAVRGFNISIWWFALGYFAAYAPYSALTKALSKGSLADIPALSGATILPVTVLTSTVGMILFLWLSGWWKQARTRTILGREVPTPGLWTFLSGICTATIVMTTTLAYTFQGVSIVFVMLLMRGGVLVLAPMVDRVSGRPVRWFSWVGLGFSFAALVVSIGGDDRYVITVACGVDVGLYLLAYFVRLRFMSKLAKSSEGNANARFFVEEQLVATPAAILLISLYGLFGSGSAADEIRFGFTEIWSHPALPVLVLIGLLSQGTGIFGGLILLDKRENTFCVPVNRASSVLAGVVASFALTLLLGQRAPGGPELAGATLLMLAIVVLSVAPMVERHRAKKAAAAVVAPGA